VLGSDETHEAGTTTGLNQVVGTVTVCGVEIGDGLAATTASQNEVFDP
jgi:hypothetical protein